MTRSALAGTDTEPEDAGEASPAPRQPRSARRVLSLLEQVAQSPDGMTLAELSAATQVPKSTILTMLSPLVCDGYLTQVRGRYLPDRAAFQLAGRLLRHRRLNLLVRPFMEDLFTAFHETVSLAQLDPETRQARYVEVLESDLPVRFVVGVGGLRPLYASASGRVLLAYQAPAFIDEYLATTRLAKLAENTPTDIAELRAILDQVRAQGYAATAGTVVDNGGAVSCPIFDQGHAVVAALAISGPLDRAKRNLPDWIAKLQQAARQISSSL